MRSTELGVRAAAAAVRSGEVTAAALVEACLDRIRAVDPAIDDRHGADVGVRFDAERGDASGERRHPRGDPRIVGVGHQQIRRARALEDLRLRVGNRLE